MAQKDDAPAASLDDRFWVWESLEEAVRDEVETMSDDDFKNTLNLFALNYKGSSDLMDMVEQRIYREADVFAK